MDEIIYLDDNTESGYFWKFFSKVYKMNFTFNEYINSLKIDKFDKKRFMYKHHLYEMEIYKSRFKPDIKIFWGNCIELTLKNTLNENLYSELSSFSTECEDIISSKLKIRNKKSEFLLKLIDAVSVCFGVKRIELIDGATPKEYHRVYIEEKKVQDIDLSLYMVMKYQETFYERYGYKICDKDIEYKIHKDLLSKFNFDIFYKLLSEDDKLVINVYKKFKCKYLGEFYVKVYDYLNSKHNKRRLLEIQSLLFNKSYPWYSMVSILTIKKKCMEKFL